jgi:hypothetical protein
MANPSVKIAAWLSLAGCIVVIGVAVGTGLRHGAAPVRGQAELASVRPPPVAAPVPHRAVRHAVRPPAPLPAPAPAPRAPAARALQPATTAPSLGSALDAALAKLAPAQVAFTAPPRMAVGHTQEIRSVLSLNLSGDALKALLPAGGRVEVDPLQVSDTMTASLYGEGFKIAPQNSQTQIVSRANTTEWHWFVTPTATGQQTLFLDFTAHLSVGGQDAQRSIITREARIDVVVGWPTTAIQDVGWLWTTLLLPAGLFTLRAWRRHHPAASAAQLR